MNTFATIVTSIVSSGIVSGLVTASQARAEERRQGYARAVQALVAYGHMPYSIRRRTSDDRETLAALVARLDTVQEHLSLSAAWVHAEDSHMGELFDECRRHLAERVGPAAQEAWGLPPVTRAAEMNVGAWGPKGGDAVVRSLEQAVSLRFGYRRYVSGRRIITSRDRVRALESAT